MKNDDLDAVGGLVFLAKAAFNNLTLLRAFEAARPVRHGRSDGRGSRAYARRTREALSKAHREGLFLQMRRQMPHLTDEALENRLLTILEHYRTTLRQVRVMGGHTSISFCHEERERSDPGLNGLLVNLPALLEALAETFLCEASDRSLRVHSRLIGPWQDLILVVPPLLISSAWIHRRAWTAADAREGHLAHRALVERMALWLCDSTLPVDNDPALDHLCRTHGLDETHMHLMGATEAEKVWRDALNRPQIVTTELCKALENVRETGLRLSIGSGVNRLLQQEDSQLTSVLLRRRLHDAAGLKTMLLHRANGTMAQGGDMRLPDRWTKQQERSLAKFPAHTPLVVKEAWLLCSIFENLNKKDVCEQSHYWFFHYALLRGQFCRLIVQQAGQTGFDQFQYITLNELRETTEKDYAERFRQIERGQQRGIDFLEGRFAPKDNPTKLVGLLGNILRGYLQFLSEDERGYPRDLKTKSRYGSFAELVALVRDQEAVGQTKPFHTENSVGNHRAMHTGSLNGTRRLRLGLVAHFIKRHSRDDQYNLTERYTLRPPCRHVKMRNDCAKQARILGQLLRDIPHLTHFIRGADAAGNERQAGPEVLAPTFRILRRAGMQRFTYHAGEDFAHIASGLRAMFEAVIFLNLDAGSRIGHGTAAGLLPEAWWAAIGKSVVLPTEDRLDDLVFARHLLVSNALLPERLALIDAEICRLAMLIWADPCITPDLLTQAWKLRHLDPLAIRFQHRDPDLHRRAEALLHTEAQCNDPAAYGHFLRRHGMVCANPEFTARKMRDEMRRGARQMTVNYGSDILDVETLRVLQSCVLKLLNQRRMAIETLPTSNVRISIYHRHEDHHALNWLGLGTESLRMPVDFVVGSDDPGIFATSLRMEYAQLLRCIRDEAIRSGDRYDPLQTLERICLNAKQFRF